MTREPPTPDKGRDDQHPDPEGSWKQRALKAEKQLAALRRDHARETEKLTRRLETMTTRAKAFEERFRNLEARKNQLQENFQASLRSAQERIDRLRKQAASWTHGHGDHLAKLVVTNAALYRDITHVQRDFDVDCVLAHDFHAAYAGLKLRDAGRARTVLFDSVEFIDFAERNEAWKRDLSERPAERDAVVAFLRGCLNQYDQIFTTSDGQARALRDHGVEVPAHTLANGRTAEAFQSAPAIAETLELPADARIVVHLNSPDSPDTADACIGALAHLPARYHLCFLGNVPQAARAAVDEAARQHAVADRVHVHGFVAQPRLLATIASGHLSLVPMAADLENLRTALPNRLFESIAARVPLISHAQTDTGAFIAEHGVGTTFAALDAASVAEAILAADAPARRDEILKNLERTGDSFSWERLFAATVSSLPAGTFGDGTRVAYVTAKKINNHNRSERWLRSLRDLGCQVSVFARDVPEPDLRVPGVTYQPLSDADSE